MDYSALTSHPAEWEDSPSVEVEAELVSAVMRRFRYERLMRETQKEIDALNVRLGQLKERERLGAESPNGN